MYLYIDSFFFINLLFDFLVVSISGRLGGIRFSFKKILMSAFVGATMSCAALFLPFAGSFLMNFVAVALMSLVAYGYRSGVNFIKQTMLLFLSFFICGGTVQALFYSNAAGAGRAEFLYVLAGFFVATAVTFLVSEKIKEGKGKSYMELYVLKDEKVHHLTALYDSGNLCTDFLTGLPVILAENVFGNVETRENLFDTASGVGEMRIFLPDKIAVEFNGRIYEGRDVAVGIIEDRISSDGSFNALVGGICFEHLAGKNKGNYKKDCIRRKNLLHRGVGTASSALEPERGRGTFTGIKKRK